MPLTVDRPRRRRTAAADTVRSNRAADPTRPRPGQPHRRRPRRQRRAWWSGAPTHAAGRGAHLVAFPEMVLTGYPVEDLALRVVVRRRLPPRRRALAARLAAEGSATCRRRRLPRPRRGRRTHAAAGPAQGSPQNAAAVLHGGRVVATLGQAPPAQLRRLRRVPLLRARRHAVGRPRPRRRRRARDLRGPLAGRRPVAAARAAGAGLLLVVNASPYERNKDDTRLDLCGARREAGCRARVREHGRRPGRAGLRRRLDRRRRRRRGARRGRRSSRRAASSSTSTSRPPPSPTAARRPHGARRRLLRPPHRAVDGAGRRRTSPSRRVSRRDSTDEAEVYAARW